MNDPAGAGHADPIGTADANPVWASQHIVHQAIA